MEDPYHYDARELETELEHRKLVPKLLFRHQLGLSGMEGWLEHPNGEEEGWIPQKDTVWKGLHVLGFCGSIERRESKHSDAIFGRYVLVLLAAGNVPLSERVNTDWTCFITQATGG